MHTGQPPVCDSFAREELRPLMTAWRSNLWTAFQDGARFKLGNSETVVTMRSENAGALALPSGQIVACDPLFDPLQRPFSTRVPAGRYPLHFVLGNDDVALVMVLIDDGYPTIWKRANPRYFSVDGGMACLMDYKVARYLRRKAEAGKYDQVVKKIEDALLENGLFGNVPLAITPDANIVVFHTWGGDGVFSSFFGYDETGKLICLVVDMLIESLDAEPVLPSS